MTEGSKKDKDKQLRKADEDNQMKRQHDRRHACTHLYTGIRAQVHAHTRAPSETNAQESNDGSRICQQMHIRLHTFRPTRTQN